MSVRVIRGEYWRDLLDQPRALRATAEALAPRRFPGALRDAVRAAGARIVLTGMGSSLHALYPLHLAWLARGVDCAWVETAELLQSQPALLARATVVVAVSQSGASAEVVRLTSSVADGARLVAVSNTAESPLVRAARDVVLTEAGPEATVACKTYLATLAALAWLERGVIDDGEAGLEEVGGGVREVAAAGEAIQADLEGRVARVAAELGDVQHVFLAGRGRSLAAVWSGALIAKEAAGVPVEGMTGAALRHGPLEMCGPDVYVPVFEGVGAAGMLQRRLARDLRDAGARVGWIACGEEAEVWRIPAGTPATAPIREALATQWLSLALAARRGREAGRFSRATKVTRVE